MDANIRNEWDEIALEEVQFVTLRARGTHPGGDAVQITYDRGTVVVTTDADSPKARARILTFGEVRSLLDALRRKATAASRSKGVDTAALRAMIGALARTVHSPGPIAFGVASFGAIAADARGVVGQVLSGPGSATTVRTIDGELSLETQREGVSGSFRRRFTIEQLRALIAALRVRLMPGNQVDPLWERVLNAAVAREAAIREALAAARGNHPFPPASSR